MTNNLKAETNFSIATASICSRALAAVAVTPCHTNLFLHSIVANLNTLDLLANKMMDILEASIARTNSESIKDDAERYEMFFKESVRIFNELPEEYRIKVHLKTDKWMGANLDAKDNEMLSSYIKVGRTLFGDLLKEVMDKYHLLRY